MSENFEAIWAAHLSQKQKGETTHNIEEHLSEENPIITLGLLHRISLDLFYLLQTGTNEKPAWMFYQNPNGSDRTEITICHSVQPSKRRETVRIFVTRYDHRQDELHKIVKKDGKRIGHTRFVSFPRYRHPINDESWVRSEDAGNRRGEKSFDTSNQNPANLVRMMWRAYRRSIEHIQPQKRD